MAEEGNLSREDAFQDIPYRNIMPTIKKAIRLETMLRKIVIKSNFKEKVDFDSDEAVNSLQGHLETLLEENELLYKLQKTLLKLDSTKLKGTLRRVLLASEFPGGNLGPQTLDQFESHLIAKFKSEKDLRLFMEEAELLCEPASVSSGIEILSLDSPTHEDCAPSTSRRNNPEESERTPTTDAGSQAVANLEQATCTENANVERSSSRRLSVASAKKRAPKIQAPRAHWSLYSKLKRAHNRYALPTSTPKSSQKTATADGHINLETPPTSTASIENKLITRSKTPKVKPIKRKRGPPSRFSPCTRTPKVPMKRCDRDNAQIQDPGPLRSSPGGSGTTKRQGRKRKTSKNESNLLTPSKVRKTLAALTTDPVDDDGAKTLGKDKNPSSRPKKGPQMKQERKLSKNEAKKEAVATKSKKKKGASAPEASCSQSVKRTTPSNTGTGPVFKKHQKSVSFMEPPVNPAPNENNEGLADRVKRQKRLPFLELQQIKSKSDGDTPRKSRKEHDDHFKKKSDKKRSPVCLPAIPEDASVPDSAGPSSRDVDQQQRSLVAPDSEANPRIGRTGPSIVVKTSVSTSVVAAPRSSNPPPRVSTVEQDFVGGFNYDSWASVSMTSSLVAEASECGDSSESSLEVDLGGVLDETGSRTGSLPSDIINGLCEDLINLQEPDLIQLDQISDFERECLI